MALEKRRQTAGRVRPILSSIALLAVTVVTPALAGGRVAWLDEILRKVVREAEAETRVEGKLTAKETANSAGALMRDGRLLVRESDAGLETLMRRSEALARTAPTAATPTEAILASRFASLMRRDPEAARVFAKLAPAERKLVVEVGETAQRLARRYPSEAEAMIRSLGAEGLAATRVFGDEVAPILAREGPESLSVLRKTGREGWSFFTREVLPHKKKLAAAGVLAAFYANPELFVDYAGRATEFAAREFAKAGVALAVAAGAGVSQGIGTSASALLNSYGLNNTVFRYILTGVATLAAILAALVLLGLPVRFLTRPILWPLRLLRRAVG